MGEYDRLVAMVREMEVSDKDSLHPLGRMKCLHKSCPECQGSGLKRDGTMCIHGVYCNCCECTVRKKK